MPTTKVEFTPTINDGGIYERWEARVGDNHRRFVVVRYGLSYATPNMDFGPLSTGYFSAYSYPTGNYINPDRPYYKTFKQAERACLAL